MLWPLWPIVVPSCLKNYQSYILVPKSKQASKNTANTPSSTSANPNNQKHNPLHPNTPHHSKPNNNQQNTNITAASLLSQNQLLIKQLLSLSLHSTTSPNSNKGHQHNSQVHPTHSSQHQKPNSSNLHWIQQHADNQRETCYSTHPPNCITWFNNVSSLKYSSS